MATNKETAEVNEAKREEMVKIRIPRTRKDEADMYVNVNNRSYLIKRGIEVKVPKCVASVLRHREKMLEEIYDFDNEHAK